MITSIIENPSDAFKKVIYSEHKNFILFIFFFICIKFLINSRFLAMLSKGEFSSTLELTISYVIVMGVFLFYFMFFSLLQTYLGKQAEIDVRFKDSLSLIIYSQLPFLFGLIILFPLELVIFGDYLFSLNPTPFVIKGAIAYLFLLLEITLPCWSTYLVSKAFLIQSNLKQFSFLAALFFIVFFWALLYLCSLFVFSI